MYRVKRHLCFFALVCVLAVFGHVCPLCAETAGVKFGYVNARKLIFSHNLFKYFNPETKRFYNTVSQPLNYEDAPKFVARMNARLKTIDAAIRGLNASYAKKMAGSSVSARRHWFEFWKKHETLCTEKSLINDAISQAKRYSGYFNSNTTDDSVLPVTNAIAASVQSLIRAVKVHHKLNIVLDESALILKWHDIGNISPNAHQMLFSYSITPQYLQGAALSLRSHLARTSPRLAFRPFVAGAIDLNPECQGIFKEVQVDYTPPSELSKEELAEIDRQFTPQMPEGFAKGYMPGVSPPLKGDECKSVIKVLKGNHSKTQKKALKNKTNSSKGGAR